MNKKLFAYTSVSVVALIVLSSIALRVTPLGRLEGLPALILQLFLTALALPLRVYVILFMNGGSESWSLPLLAGMILVSGLFWGLIIERASHWARKLFAHG